MAQSIAKLWLGRLGEVLLAGSFEDFFIETVLLAAHDVVFAGVILAFIDYP